MNSALTMQDTLSDGIRLLMIAFPEHARRALGHAGLALWHDIVHLPPKPHVDTGYTRGSISVHVAGKLINKAEATKEGAPVPNSVKMGNMEAWVAVNSPYAARLHELPAQALGPRSRAEGGVGPKFVEAKIAWGSEKYMRIMAKEFMRSLETTGFSRGLLGTK